LAEVGSPSSPSAQAAHARIFAVDLSPEALKVAESNARRLDVTINFFQSDLLKDLRSNVSGGFDMIAANPPYVAATDLPHLEPELSYEPRLALDGGKDGLDVVRRLVPEGFSFLKSGGVLAMEIGHDQGGAVGALFSQAGFEDVCILKDYNGHDRIAKGRKRGSI
jgi:release factor glutamine methyltransferase